MRGRVPTVRIIESDSTRIGPTRPAKQEDVLFLLEYATFK